MARDLNVKTAISLRSGLGAFPPKDLPVSGADFISDSGSADASEGYRLVFFGVDQLS